MSFDLHLNDESFVVVRMAFYIHGRFPGVGPQPNLLLRYKRHRIDLFVWQKSLYQVKKQVFVARSSENQFECIINPEIDINDLSHLFRKCVA